MVVVGVSEIGRIDLYVKVQCTPRVTLGEILRDFRQELLLGRFYVTTAKSYSWAVFKRQATRVKSRLKRSLYMARFYASWRMTFELT